MATARERRYWASKEKRIRYATVEFYHEAIGVYRFVMRQYFDKSFTLESDAPRNPSESVTFTPLAGEISPEAQSSNSINRTITLSRIGAGFTALMKSLDSSDRYKPAEAIIRYYIQGEESAPSNIPQTYYVENVKIGADSVIIKASDERPFNTRVARVYREDKLTGLKGFV